MPKALDLFCGAGGSSVGLHRAGFDQIVGVDINPQPEYPFNFIQSNVFQLDMEVVKDTTFIWSSPPCQAYSWSAKRWTSINKYPDLVSATRTLLSQVETPFVIENVKEAPIRKDLMLCGEMFRLKVLKHRYFELHGFGANQPTHRKHRGSVSDGFYCTVAGHGGDGKASLKAWQDAMEIDWITDKKMLAEAVPPAYGEYIGKEFFEQKCLTNWQE